MNFIRFVHLSAYFLPHLTTAQKTSLSLSKRHWECFMRAASFLLECTLYELIYLYLNNVWSYRHGIRIVQSLVSNKPVTATTRLLSSREVIQQTTHGDRKNKGSTKTSENTLLSREAILILNHPLPPCQVFAASCTEDLGGGCEVGCLQMFTKSSSYVSKATGQKMWQACLETHTSKNTE